MRKKKTLDRNYFENLALERNHTLVEVCDTEGITKSTITLNCNTCKTRFTTSAISYRDATKTGCLACHLINRARNKSEQLMIKKQLKEDLEKNTTAAKQLKVEQKKAAQKEKEQKFAHIKNATDLMDYLKTNSNVYHDYIIQRLLVLPEPTTGIIVLTEKHHIIPIHAGGDPRAAWNLVTLTLEEHFIAHDLRAQTFGEKGDKLACLLKTLKAQEGNKLRDQAGQPTARKRKTRVYDSIQQSINGKKSKTGLTPARIATHRKKMSLKIKENFSTKVIWQHNKLNCRITIEPNTLEVVSQLIPLFIKAMSESSQLELQPLALLDLKRLKAKPESNVIAKVIREERKSCYGWFIVETNLQLPLLNSKAILNPKTILNPEVILNPEAITFYDFLKRSIIS